MAQSGPVHINGQYHAILPAVTITTAVAAGLSAVVTGLIGMWIFEAQAILTYGSGGTSADAYVQTSLDHGVTWIDIMNFHFTTASATKVSVVNLNTALSAAVAPTDGSLTANTILSGVLGDRVRVKYITVGTYAASTTLQVTGISRG